MTASIGEEMAPGSDKAKRILIIVENLPVPFDRRVWSEATTLSTAGYEVSVICPKGKGHQESFEKIEGVRVYRHDLPFEARGRLAYIAEYGTALYHQFRLAWRIHRTHGFDVLQGCNPPDTIFLIGGFYKLFFGKKYVFDHHDICPELFEAKFGRRGGVLYLLMCALERLTFSTADISISTNNSYRRIAINRGCMAPDRVFVVRSGPNLSRLKIQPPIEKIKKGARYLIGYVGVIGQQEGLDLLVDAAEYLTRTIGRNDVHFAVVGSGPEQPLIQQEVMARGLGDLFTFSGRVPDAELLDILNTADICVNPDRVNDMNDKSTMNKILEYMALGKPIVQFEMTEGRESAGDSSLYARPNDPADFAEKINALLDDPELRAKMGEIGRQRIIEKFSWEHSITPLLAAYEKVFEGS